MDAKIMQALKLLSGQAAIGEPSPDFREAAVATSGLPVFGDIAGILALTPAGAVVLYDPESRRVTPVEDRKWQTVAFVKAARKFPELASLFPMRPPDAASCGQCGGKGVIAGVADCGKCMGTGWVQSDGN